MKRLLILVVWAACVMAAHAQVNSQRVIFTAGNPPTACVSGKVYTNPSLNPAKSWVGTSTGACTPTDASGSAPSNATYITETANSTLTNEFALGSLATGILKNTTTTGVPSIAVAGDFPTLNQNTSGTAANVSGTPALPNGTTGTTQAVDDNTAKLATDVFVLAQAASANPIIDGTAAPGTSTRYARADHVHPTDTSRVPTTRSLTIGGTAQDLSADRSWLGNVTNDTQTKAAVVPNTAPSAGQVPVGNAGGTAYAPVSISGDATLTSTGSVAVVKVNGNTPGGTCTNQFAGSIDSSGRPTCRSITATDLGTTLTPQFAGVGIGRSASGPFYVLAPAATNLRMFFEAPAGQQVQFHGLITGTQDTVWGVDSSGNFNISTADDNFGAGKRFSLNASSGAAIFFNSLAIGNGTAILKHLSATSTLDFANLAAIGCEDLTITVTGAALGDSVALGIPNGSVVANGTFTGWVSAADTVTVRFCTVVSGNPASGTFRADVWQH